MGALSAIVSVAQDVLRTDSLRNLVSRLGVEGADKRMAAQFGLRLALSDSELDALYAQDGLARRIVEQLPADALRKGVAITTDAATDPAAVTALTDALDAVRWLERIEETWRLARLYGGAALLLGVDDGQLPSEPLREDALRSLRWVYPVDRTQLVPAGWAWRDPMSALGGEPEAYDFTPVRGGSAQRVHRSRLIRFDGVRLPDRVMHTRDDWRVVSVLEPCHDALKNFRTVYDAMASTAADFTHDVWSVKGLGDLLSRDGGAAYRERVAFQSYVRSAVNATILDADGEQYERRGTPVTGLADLARAALDDLAIQTDYPVSLLLGQRTGGLDTSNDGDMERYRERVATAQGKGSQLYRAIVRLVQLMQRAKDGPTRGVEFDVWDVTFPPLRELDEVETANLRKTLAETDAVYVSAGVLTAAEVALSRFGTPGQFGAEITIDTDARAAMPAGGDATPETEETPT